MSGVLLRLSTHLYKVQLTACTLSVKDALIGLFSEQLKASMVVS